MLIAVNLKAEIPWIEASQGILNPSDWPGVHNPNCFESTLSPCALQLLYQDFY